MFNASTPVPEWMKNAACGDVNPDVFAGEDKLMNKLAKEICGTCPVKMDCLQYALKTRVTWGVWGGLTDLELLRSRSVNRQNQIIERIHSPNCPKCLRRDGVGVRGRQARCRGCGFDWRLE